MPSVSVGFGFPSNSDDDDDDDTLKWQRREYERRERERRQAEELQRRQAEELRRRREAEELQRRRLIEYELEQERQRERERQRLETERLELVRRQAEEEFQRRREMELEREREREREQQRLDDERLELEGREAEQIRQPHGLEIEARHREMEYYKGHEAKEWKQQRRLGARPREARGGLEQDPEGAQRGSDPIQWLRDFDSYDIMPEQQAERRWSDAQENLPFVSPRRGTHKRRASDKGNQDRSSYNALERDTDDFARLSDGPNDPDDADDPTAPFASLHSGRRSHGRRAHNKGTREHRGHNAPERPRSGLSRLPGDLEDDPNNPDDHGALNTPFGSSPTSDRGSHGRRADNRSPEQEKQREEHPRHDTSERVRNDLVRLNDKLKPSDVTFASPKDGFDQLAELVQRICNVANKAEGGGELARDLRQEKVQTQKVNALLFKDKRLLRLPAPVYEQLSVIGQRAIAAAGACSWDSLLGALSEAGDNASPMSCHDALETALEAVRDANQAVKAHLRYHLLESDCFYNRQVLEQVSHAQGGYAADLGLVRDAALRLRNMNMRPDLFESRTGTDGDRPGHRHGGKQCSVCIADDDDVELLSGKIEDTANDDFLTFPGRLNNIPLKPLIDTGGGCNLVKRAWVESQGIEIELDPSRSETLVMADGSESKCCPIIVVKWSFDDRKKAWVDVEFVVVDNYKYDALIGLPFLKHTETIHNSAGRLVFPEFKGVHAKKEGIPLYNFRKLKASR